MKRLAVLVFGVTLLTGAAGCWYSPGFCDPCSGCYHGGCWEPCPCGPLDLFGWWSRYHGCHGCCHNDCGPCGWQSCGCSPGWGPGGCACDCCGTCCPGGACGIGPGYAMSNYGAYSYAGEEPVYEISEENIHSGNPIYPEGTPEENRAPLPDPAPVQPMGGYRQAYAQPVHNAGYSPQRQTGYPRQPQWAPARF